MIQGKAQLSPAFFPVFLDGLLEKLRRLGVGCGLCCAVCFADDLILLNANSIPKRLEHLPYLKNCQIQYGWKTSQDLSFLALNVN